MVDKTQTKPDTVMINFDSKVLPFKKRVINAVKILFGKRIILVGTIDQKIVKK